MDKKTEGKQKRLFIVIKILHTKVITINKLKQIPDNVSKDITVQYIHVNCNVPERRYVL